MMLIDGQIHMTDKEWEEFRNANWAPWRPRTVEEFNAMCDLAAARHRAEDSAGLGEVLAIATGKMKFGPNGEVNFPMDRRREAYMKVHGSWPTNEQLLEFEAAPQRDGMPALRLVANPDGESP